MEAYIIPAIEAADAAIPGSGSLSCDVYDWDGAPCAAAYSMDRALYAYYDGPLYQVQRASDGAAADIGTLSAGGDVNAAEQDSFCAGTSCTVTRLYDQSPEWNDLTIEGSDSGSSATALPITIGGNEAYGLDIAAGDGYRDNSTRGIAVNGEPEGMYMAASGTNVNSGCCYDFGNAETNNGDNGAGHMDALNIATWCGFPPCTGGGPWVQADMENGQYMGGSGSNPNDTGNNSDFVTGILKNDGQATFELEGGNAQSGGLSKFWDGSLPSGYAPMHQEGAIVLGTGGDNSHWSIGSFFEGVMTQGFPSDAADAAVQAGIVSAGYAGNSGGSPAGLKPPAGTITMAGGNCADVIGDDTGTNGSAVDSWSCLSTAVDQHWTHNANGSLETLGRCLGISTAPGAGGTGTGVAGDHATLWDCNGSGVEQWVQRPDGTLYNPPSGLCLYGQPSNGYQLSAPPNALYFRTFVSNLWGRRPESSKLVMRVRFPSPALACPGWLVALAPANNLPTRRVWRPAGRPARARRAVHRRPGVASKGQSDSHRQVIVPRRTRWPALPRG